MDTENLKDSSAFITHRELVRTQDELRKELAAKVEGTNRRIEDVDDKVDNLRDLVLPLLETSKQTAENTRKMADSMDKFTEGQRATNGRIYEKLNVHDIEFTRINVSSGAQTEKKKVNGTIIVAVIGAVTTLIASLFALAPLVYGG